MWEFKIFGVTVYYLFSLLLIFSFLGWVWESLYVSINEKHFANRGYVTGPVCTIYGVAFVIAFVLLRPFSDSKAALFIGGVIISTVIEYVTATVMQAVFHTSWWDYTDKRFNYKGKICLSASILWGCLAVIMFTVLLPMADSFIALYPAEKGKIAYMIILGIYIVDFSFSTIAAVDIGKQLNKLEIMIAEFGRILKRSRVYSSSEELLWKLSVIKRQILNMGYIKKYSKRLEIIQAVYMDRLSNLGSSMVSEILSATREIYERVGSGAGKARLMLTESRILKAYPKIKSSMAFSRHRYIMNNKGDAAENNKNAEDPGLMGASGEVMAQPEILNNDTDREENGTFK